MTDRPSPHPIQKTLPDPTRRKSSLPVKLLKVIGFAALAVILLVAALITVAVSYLQPEN